MRKSRSPWPPVTAVAVAGFALGAAPATDDPFQWLEEVQGENALAWVKEQNAKTLRVLEARPEYKPIYDKTLEILDSKDKIPTPELLGDHRLQLLEGRAHERGIWRRTTLASYRTATPAVGDGARRGRPGEGRRQALGLQGRRLPAPGRHALPGQPLPRRRRTRSWSASSTRRRRRSCPAASRSRRPSRSVAWRDEDTLWVGTDFGAGSLTTSGYPRIVKLWKRGTPLVGGEDDLRGQDGGRRRVRDERASRATAATTSSTRIPDDLHARTSTCSSAIASSSWTCRRTSTSAASSAGGSSSRCAATGRSGARRIGKARSWRRRRRSRSAAKAPKPNRSSSRRRASRSPNVKRTKDRVLLETLDNVKQPAGVALRSRTAAWDASRDSDARARHRGPRSPRPTTSADVSSSPTRTSSPRRLAVALRERRGRRRRSRPCRPSSTRRACTTEQLRSHLQGRHEDPVLRGRRRRAFKTDGTAPTLLYGYGGFEVSEVADVQRRRSASPGSRAAACTRWPTSAAAASSAPPGTRPR